MTTNVKHINYVQPDTLAQFLSESTHDVLFEAISRYVPSGAKILDVGCGRGELLKRLSENGYEAYGCDMDDECVEMSNSYGNVQKLAVEEISPDRFGGKFECVVMSHVLEHVENPKEALLRLATISRAFSVISVPNPYYSPFVLHALFRRNIKYVNTGHLYNWDWHHFKTFVEVGCKQKVLEWLHDSVALPATDRIRNSLNEVGVLHPLENRLLRGVFPRFCRSITAVVKVQS